MSKIQIRIYALPTQKATNSICCQHMRNGHNEWWISDCEVQREEPIDGLTINQADCIIPYHLYITTSEIPKQGDWFLTDERNHVRENNGVPIWSLLKCDNITNGWLESNSRRGEGFNPNWSRKVVATDDKDLYFQPYEMKTWSDNSPDQISPEFQQAWVREANKGTPIVDAMMEMENSYEEWTPDGIKEFFVQQPKLNDKGFVTILPIKEKKEEIDWESVFDNAQSMHLQEFISYYKEQNF